MDKNKVYCMDCIEFLKKIPDDSVDSCVTDPPYGLEFMQASWDKLGTGELISDKDDWDWQNGRGTDPLANKPRLGPVMTNTIARNRMQQWHHEWAVEVFRVLKPGAHILAFSGTRTYHRLACAIEDAGFEVRNMIVWIYGSGFPKGLDVSFGIMQKQLYEWLEDYPKKRERFRSLKGTERRQYMIELMVEADIAEVLDRAPLPWNERKQWTDFRGGRFHRADGELKHTSYQHIMPKTPEAKEWHGFNTQLKPAIEPIVFARKPISEKTIVENALKHGTAAINIDACRIAVSPEVDAVGKTTKRATREAETWREGSGFKNPENVMAGVLPSGRYPANLILSHHPDCKLIQEGTTKVKDMSTHAQSLKMDKHGIYGVYQVPVNLRHGFQQTSPEVWACVEGCPVRMLNEQSGNINKAGSRSFMDCSDNRRSDRMGAHGIYGSASPAKHCQRYGDAGGAARFFYCAKPSVAERNAGMNGSRNIHITVKPLSIMRWLVKLVTPRGGVVLDPFLGSGTTAIAAENEGCDWLACDNNEDYCRIAEARIAALGGTQTTLTDFEEAKK